MHTARTEDSPTYLRRLPAAKRDADDETIRLALVVLLKRMRTVGATMGDPQAVKDYLRLQLASLEHEAFGVLFLDAQHRAIDFRVMFRGTICQTSVYPREVVKEALALNAAAVVLAHNHPSNVTEPSRADEFLTTTLKAALALVDVRVIDHIVVGALGCTSMAERGLI